LDDTVICLVRGPASRYPRGFIWLIPAWFAILSAAVLAVGTNASGSLPLWLALTEIGGLAIAAGTALAVLVTVRQPAFRADNAGICLGVSTSRSHPKLRQVQLAWPEIAQLRMVPRRYGVLLEISLGPAARIVHRAGLGRQAVLVLGMLVMPFAFGRGRPGLTNPRMDPPRYRLKICAMNSAELRLALDTVRPDTLSVRVLPSKAALRFSVAPPRKPVTRRPPTPVG
jgi:hypothetical protein